MGLNLTFTDEWLPLYGKMLLYLHLPIGTHIRYDYVSGRSIREHEAHRSFSATNLFSRSQHKSMSQAHPVASSSSSSSSSNSTTNIK